MAAAGQHPAELDRVQLQLGAAGAPPPARRAGQRERPWQPKDRDRPVSKALRAYAALATSADKGAVRQVP